MKTIYNKAYTLANSLERKPNFIEQNSYHYSPSLLKNIAPSLNCHFFLRTKPNKS